MTPLLLISTLIISHLYSVAGQSDCTTPSRTSGKCMPVHNCSSLSKLLTNPSPADRKLLQKSFCGFKNSVPQVCCPTLSCVTPDGTQGTCMELYSCPHLLNIFTSNPTPVDIEYLQRHRCHGPEQYSLCCAPLSTRDTIGQNSVDSGTGQENCQLTAYPPDPSTNCCGVDARGGGNRIFGGNWTTVDEYPWLAIIEYAKNNKIKLLCGGVLISGRYVMTASHCIVGPVLKVGRPLNVRLGEYDTSHSGSDCVEVEGGGEDCNDGALTVPIEKTIPHPEYNAYSQLKRHDIGLIRLRRIVRYTYFIKPICLPTADFSTSPGTNELLYAAGWGAVSATETSSNVKLKVDLPFVSYQECQPSYSVRGRQVQLWEGQICAGGEKGKDSCKGDSGGPLMRENGRLYELVGIVSFGPTPCGLDNVPGVYTKVFHYLPWITSQIVA